MGIIEQITAALKDKVVQVLPDFSQLDYEYNVEDNNERSYNKRFGVIGGAANFPDNSTLGFITISQDFQIILTTDFLNHDGDESQRDAAFYLNDKMHSILKELHNKKLSSTPDYQILLVNGISFEQMEFLVDNGVIVARLNLTVHYKFRNKC